MNLIEFGKKAYEIRENCGFTREDVKEYTGISVETLRRLERGIPEPKLSTLEKLSNLYRYDLIELFSNNRNPLSLFSESLMRQVNEKLNTLDYEGLIDVINHAFDEVANLDPDEQANHDYYSQFLLAFKSLRLKETRDLPTNVMNVENILLALAKNQAQMLSTPYLYPFEVSVAIYLASIYRRKKEPEKSILFCDELLKKLDAYPSHNDRTTDQIGALYQAIAYAYHILDAHEKVVETIDKALMDRRLAFTNTLFTDMLMRKAIAFHNMGKRESYDLFTVAILNSQGERRKSIIDVVKQQYKIDHHIDA